MIHVPVGLLRNTHQHIQLHILHPPHIHLLPAQCKTKNSNILSSAFIIHRERLEIMDQMQTYMHWVIRMTRSCPKHPKSYLPMRPNVYSRTYTIDMVQPSDLSCKYKTASMAPQNSMQLDPPTRRNQRRRSKRIRWIQRILNTPLLSPIWGKGPPASAAVHVSHRQRSNGHPNSTTTICSLGSGC